MRQQIVATPRDTRTSQWQRQASKVFQLGRRSEQTYSLGDLRGE